MILSNFPHPQRLLINLVWFLLSGNIRSWRKTLLRILEFTSWKVTYKYKLTAGDGAWTHNFWLAGYHSHHCSVGNSCHLTDNFIKGLHDEKFTMVEKTPSMLQAKAWWCILKCNFNMVETQKFPSKQQPCRVQITIMWKLNSWQQTVKGVCTKDPSSHLRRHKYFRVRNGRRGLSLKHLTKTMNVGPWINVAPPCLILR